MRRSFPTLARLILLGCMCHAGLADLLAQEPADEVTVDANSVVAYIESCRKPNGAFGPRDQEYTDAAWNFPAVHVLRLLGEPIKQREQVLAHGLGSPAGHVGYGHLQFFHEHMIRAVLDDPFAAEHPEVMLTHQGYEPRYYGSPYGISPDHHFKPLTGEERTAIDRKQKQFGYYNLSSLYYVLMGMGASRRPPSNRADCIDFVMQRQAPCGGFVDIRSTGGKPRDEEAHLVHTMQAVVILDVLRERLPNPERLEAFVYTCQHADGSFGPNSDPQAKADIYYTWAALQTLSALGKPVHRSEDCTHWILSLQNADGGFGDRPGWRSRLYSTDYAVHALQLLHRNARKAIPPRKVRKPQQPAIPEGQFQVYQALFKMPEPRAEELPLLAKRGFHLLGIKSDKFAEAQPLLAAIREQKLPLDVVLTPEAYPHRLLGLGGVTLNHVGNFSLDPRWTSEQLAIWKKADEAGKANKPWAEYRDQVLLPLQKLGSLCYPEQDFEQEHAYLAYDQPGYNAVLAGFNWAPHDFVRVFPWRERYTTRLTPIADADAHGDLAKWSPQLDHTRMLFIGKGPTYADFLEAAANQRVVCVVAQPEGVPSGASYYGPPAAVAYVRQRVDAWRWWGE